MANAVIVYFLILHQFLCLRYVLHFLYYVLMFFFRLSDDRCTHLIVMFILEDHKWLRLSLYSNWGSLMSAYKLLRLFFVFYLSLSDGLLSFFFLSDVFSLWSTYVPHSPWSLLMTVFCYITISPRTSLLIKVILHPFPFDTKKMSNDNLASLTLKRNP